MAAYSTTIGTVVKAAVPTRVCEYVSGSGEHTYVEMVRGDNAPEIVCTAHLCRGQTGCNNTMRPMGRGGPFCARPECAEWATMWDVGLQQSLHDDGWRLLFSSNPAFDVHEMAYLRDVSAEMRYAVDEIFCRPRGIDPLTLARTWTGAMRRPIGSATGGMPRWVQMRQERGCSPAAHNAAIAANNIEAAIGLLNMDAGEHAGVSFHIQAGAHGSVEMLAAMMQYARAHPSWLRGFTSERDMDEIAWAAVYHDRADILEFLLRKSWHSYMAKGAYFATAVKERKLKAAGWLRRRGGNLSYPGHEYSYICDMLAETDPEGNADLLWWLHTNLPAEAETPCQGRCDWWREHRTQ